MILMQKQKLNKSKKCFGQAISRSELMRRVTSKDSAAELSLRSALHARGLRFRLHRRIEKVTVDIVFVSARLAILVDGCFWHCCPKHGTSPKSNQDYWIPKLADNMARDQRQTAQLLDAGWLVMRIWEHDCLPPSANVVNQIVELIASRSR